jgi:hypothetical protein
MRNEPKVETSKWSSATCQLQSALREPQDDDLVAWVVLARISFYAL